MNTRTTLIALALALVASAPALAQTTVHGNQQRGSQAMRSTPGPAAHPHYQDERHYHQHGGHHDYYRRHGHPHYQPQPVYQYQQPPAHWYPPHYQRPQAPRCIDYYDRFKQVWVQC